MEDKDKLKIERQKFQMHKDGYDKVSKAIESLKEEDKSEIQKVELSGVSIVTLKGDKGDKPSKDELKEIIEPLLPTDNKLESLIKPLIPKLLKGEDGKDYKLTDKDKNDIAKKIKVPIVDKIIEKTIVEKPVVNEIIKNIENKDSGEQIIKKIENNDKWIKPNALKDETISFLRSGLGRSSGGVNALKLLTDVRLDGVPQDEQGNYLLNNLVEEAPEDGNVYGRQNHSWASLPTPMVFKGAIAVASDFPTLLEVKIGWLYTITANVTDNDPLKTNTELSFSIKDEIAWNGTTWVIIGNESLYLLKDGSTTGATSQAQTFTNGVNLSNLTQGYLPYASNSSKLLANSPVYTDGTNVGIGTTNPNSKLQVSGSLSLPYVAKTADYTLTATDYTVDCNGTFTITLPTAVGITGRIYNIKNSGVGIITVDGNSSETIDGELTQTLDVQYDNLQIQSTGSSWIIL